MRRALYRTYRPKDFNDVVGQDHVVDLLQRALEQKNVAHAYLFTGPRGTGKTTVARLMAYGITGLDYAGDKLPVDIIEMDAASNRGIDDIRDLRDRVVVAPLQAAKKVYIIDEVHMLTKEGFNALLKTLEEPPEHVVFILATTDVHKVPATILSRTQRYHFRLAPKHVLIDRLKHIASEEKILADNAALEMIADMGGGSFRDSISLLDQLSSGGEQITAELVATTLGVPLGEHIEAIVRAVVAKDAPTALKQIAELKDEGIAPEVIVHRLTEACLIQGEKSPTLYKLAAELMNIPVHMPLGLALSAVVAAQTVSHEGTKTVPQVATVDTIVLEKKVEVEPKPVTPETVPQKSTKPIKAEHFVWTDVLAVAQNNPLLISLLQRAEAEYSDGVLHLTFAFPLHRKKMEQAKYRELLSDILAELYGGTIELQMADAGKKELTPELAAVQELMGGGEVVRGE